MNTTKIGETKGRIVWLDITKGIAVSLMIIGHTVFFGSLTRNMIFSFHMPLFFVVSGYTIQAAGTFRQEAKRIARDAKRLWLPLLAVLALGAALDVFRSHQSVGPVLRRTLARIAWGNGCNYNFRGVDIAGIGVVWFLIALFFARILYRILLRFFPDEHERIPVVALLMAAGLLIGDHVWLPQSLDIVLVSMVFMEAGHVGRTTTISKKQSTLLFVVAFSLWFYCVVNEEIYIEIATRSYPYGILSVAVALCGCLCVVRFSRLLEATMLARPLGFVGRHSLLLLLVHSMDYLYTGRLFNFLSSVFPGLTANNVPFATAQAIADILVMSLLVALQNLPAVLPAKNKHTMPRV